jgi:hypothetical protein
MLENVTDYATIIIAFTLLGIYMQLENAGKILQSMSAFIRKETK